MAKFGTVALIGRPNAGKSTLLNHWLGEKLSIVSDKPQTTRQRIVGILSNERGQMVFYDTPGVHKPLHRLNRQMVQHAVTAMNDADVVCVLVDVSQPAGSGDAFLIELVKKARAPKIVLFNKIDLVAKRKLLPRMESYSLEKVFDEIVPVSALSGDGADLALDILWQKLPEGEPRFDAELLTTHPERFLAAERIREKVLAETRDELPFATAVAIERWEEDEEKGLARIYAELIVEREGQKKILIGKAGERVKSIGTAARLDLEEFLGRRVFLDLRVKVVEDWRESRGMLAELDRFVGLDGDLEGD